MSAHTPGEWRVDFDNPEEPCVWVPAFHDGKEFGRYEICNRVGGQVINGPEFDDYSQVEANARLIAAAPDLAEALQAMLIVHDHGECEAMHPDTAERMARDALAKAGL